MHTLRISCFGILLKHHLLRHHADELAPRGRLRPAVEAALSAVQTDFEVHPHDPLPVSYLAEGQEQRLTVHLRLGETSKKAAALSICVQGILARRGVVENPCLMPYSVRLLALPDENPLTTAEVLQALAWLACGNWNATVETESRVGPFRPPTLLKESTRPGLARVA